MPIKQSFDKRGKYYQFGDSGKKYYFNTERGRKMAYEKAQIHGQAIAISKYIKK